MARRILNRKDLRADYDAAQRRKDGEERDEDEEETEAEDDKEAADGEEEGDKEAEQAPKKKKQPAAKATKPRSRARAAKVTRLRLVWGVFSNSNQCVATYEYPKKQEALDHAARLTTDKRSTHFVQPVKELIEEKTEK